MQNFNTHSERNRFCIFNKKEKRQWWTSADEAYLYCSKVYGFSEGYIVLDTQTGKQVNGLQIISLIWNKKYAGAKNA